MKASKNAYCLINVDGRDRRLFTMIEKPAGDLMISFQTANFMKDGAGRRYEGQKIVSQKYSVHPSFDSPTQIHAIKHTAVLKSGDTICAEHYTEAIKKHGRFAYIASVMCPHLGQDKYISPKRALKNLKFGSYEPDLMTLQYALFVGARASPFSPVESDDFNYCWMDFSLFRLVVLWSFSPIGSGLVGTKAHGRTMNPEWLTDETMYCYEGMASGLDAEECVVAFRAVRNLIHDARLARVVDQHPELAAAVSTIRSMGHFKNPLSGATKPTATAL